MKHVHAENMALYAEDALETDEPWLRWESSYINNPGWSGFTHHPNWNDNVEYRRIPQTIDINGHKVPKPVCEELTFGLTYFVPALSTDTYVAWAGPWSDNDSDRELLKKGVIHLTKEAAVTHAKALLSFTEVE